MKKLIIFTLLLLGTLVSSAQDPLNKYVIRARKYLEALDTLVITLDTVNSTTKRITQLDYDTMLVTVEYLKWPNSIPDSAIYVTNPAPYFINTRLDSLITEIGDSIQSGGGGPEIDPVWLADKPNYFNKVTNTTDDITEGVTNLWDKIVTLTEDGIINISGTYPNFTISATEVDGSITNELQDFDIAELVGTNLRLSLTQDADVYIVDLSSLQDGTGTDNQTLSFDELTGILSILNGNTVNLDLRYLVTEVDPIFTAHTVYNISNGTGFLVNDGIGNWSYDNTPIPTVNNPTITLQGTAVQSSPQTFTLNQSANKTITINDNTGTDNQTISTTGAAGNISIEDGNTLNLNVNDADANSTNELQDLSDGGRVGNIQTIDISNGTSVSFEVGGDLANAGLDTITQLSHGFVAGKWISYTTTGTVQYALADTSINADVFGIIVEILDANTFTFKSEGLITGGSWTEGANYFLSTTSPGDAVTSQSYAENNVYVWLGTGTESGFNIDIGTGTIITIHNYAPIDTLSSFLPLSGGNITGNLTIQTNQVWHAGIFDDNSTNWNTAYTHSQVVTGNPHNVLATQITDFDTEVSNNSSVTANTAKVTNATHTGEVTGSTTLTIADNIIEEANLEVTNSPTDNWLLSSDTGTGGFTWVDPKLQDVSNGDKTASFTHDASTASIGAYTLSTTSAVTVSIHNLSSGMQGTIFMDIASNPSSITINGYSDAGTTLLSNKITLGAAIANAASKATSVTYTCANDGTSTKLYLTYGQEE